MIQVEKYKLKILWLISNNNESELLLQIKEITENMKEEKTKDEIIYHLFSDIYDEIFYDIAFKKTQLSIQTRKLLEALALPVNTSTLKKKEKLLHKINSIC